MEVKNIKGSRDYIDVYFSDKVVRIPGELVHGGFVADYDGIKEWKDGGEISDDERREIALSVMRKTKGSHMVISFE